MNDPTLSNDPNLATYTNSIFDIIRFCQTGFRPRLSNKHVIRASSKSKTNNKNNEIEVNKV